MCFHTVPGSIRNLSDPETAKADTEENIEDDLYEESLPSLIIPDSLRSKSNVNKSKEFEEINPADFDEALKVTISTRRPQLFSVSSA